VGVTQSRGRSRNFFDSFALGVGTSRRKLRHGSSDDDDRFTGKYLLKPYLSHPGDMPPGQWVYQHTYFDTGIQIQILLYCVGGFWVIWAQKYSLESEVITWVKWYAEQPSAEWGDCPPLEVGRWTRVGKRTPGR
jgi:hypothetical protein